MLRLFKRIYRMIMILLWILIILIGTVLTIIGGLKLNEEWTKKDVVRKSHIIPDFLLLDFDVKGKLPTELSQQILSEVKPKIHIHGNSIDKVEKIHLSGFFDEKTFKKQKQAKKNFKLSKSIYSKLRNFDIIANSSSKNKSVLIGLTKNTNKVIFSPKDKELKDSYIEVKNYNQKTNEFNISYHNIQLNVENHRLSKFITDLDKGDFSLILIAAFNETELTNIKLKTKTTEYFTATEVKNNGLNYNGKLKLMLT